MRHDLDCIRLAGATLLFASKQRLFTESGGGQTMAVNQSAEV